MVTRSLIGIMREDNKIEYVHCLYDGYLEHNGKILAEFYNTAQKVEELLQLGNIEYLNETISKTEFFEEERDNNATKLAEDLTEYEEDFAASACEYAYVFMNNEWYYLSVNTKSSEWKKIGSNEFDYSVVTDTIKREVVAKIDELKHIVKSVLLPKYTKRLEKVNADLDALLDEKDNNEYASSSLTADINSTLSEENFLEQVVTYLNDVKKLTEECVFMA